MDAQQLGTAMWALGCLVQGGLEPLAELALLALAAQLLPKVAGASPKALGRAAWGLSRVGRSPVQGLLAQAEARPDLAEPDGLPQRTQ